MGGYLIVNPRAGKASLRAEELVRSAQSRGLQVHLLRPDDDPAELALRAPDGPLGVAGGDGTLGQVAQVAIDRAVPFVCVPFGTRNHFARDLGLDRDDPLAALDAFSGRERRIDVGRVGERVFLNNLSLGMYARLVHHRERHRRRDDALARARAALIALRQRSPRGVSIDGERVVARVFLVANNAYKLDLLELGERSCLDSGRLYLYAGNGVLRSTWTERSAERFEIDAAAGQLAAAVDGEPEVLETPFVVRSDPRVLRVLVPPGLED